MLLKVKVTEYSARRWHTGRGQGKGGKKVIATEQQQRGILLGWMLKKKAQVEQTEGGQEWGGVDSA